MVTPANSQGVPASTALESLYIQIIRLLPRNALSQAVGRLSDLELPEPLRAPIYREFARLTGVKLEEAELPLNAYPSVNAFFTRQLKPGLRPISRGPGLLCSPVDAVVSAHGRIEGGQMVQTKGRLYESRDLLGGQHEAAPFEGGHFITLYLSPKDYHRIHSPLDGHIRGHSYNPGHLFPVNGPSVKQVDRLFCVNERVCVYLDAFVDAADAALGVHSSAGVPVALVMVGATCVGRMSLSYDDLVTNVGPPVGERAHFHEGKAIGAGDELGRFNLGSTVILLIGDPAFKFADAVEEGYAIRLGAPLGTCAL